MDALLPYRRSMNEMQDISAQNVKQRQTIWIYRRTGGPQQTSIAVRRRKIRVAIRARTLGRELPNDMRASMADWPSLSTEILPRSRPREAKRHLDAKTSTDCGHIHAHSFKRFIQLKVSLHQVLDTPGIALNYPWH
jgi:hypothetical protein